MSAAEQYLPGMFRKRRVNPIVNSVDPTFIQNILAADAPDGSEMPGLVQPTLAQQAMARAVPVDETAMMAAQPPNILQPTAPAPMVPAPISPTTGEAMDANAMRPRRVETDSKGRPIPQVNAVDDTQQALEYNQRLNAYEPQKAKGWWDRYVKPALIGGGIGFLNGGLGGAMGGAAYNAIQGGVNPRRQDEQWKARKLGQSNAQVGGIYKQQGEARDRQKETAEIERIGAVTNESRVRARKMDDEIRRGKWLIKQDAKGVYRPVNAQTGLDPQGNTVEGRTPADAGEWILKTDESGTIVPVNKKTGLDQNGNPVRTKSMVQTPEGFVDVTEKYKADTASGAAGAANAAIDTNIAEMTKERDGISEALKNVPAQVDDIDPLLQTVRGKKPNPVYTDYMDRYRQLDDQIRKARTERKTAPRMKTVTKDNDPLGILN